MNNVMGAAMPGKMSVQYETIGQIGIITLSNPPYNRLTDPVFESRKKLSRFIGNENLKGLIVKGDGKHFCAGADLDLMRQQIKKPEQFEKSLNEGKQLLNLLSHATIPLVAAIRGSCLGAGLEIALSCHFRIASDNSLLGFPESEQGLMPGFGGTYFSPKTIRKNYAIELILTGDMVNGHRAKELGIVDKCIPSGELDNAAIDFLKKLTDDKTTGQIRSILTSIHNAELLPRMDAFRQETLLFSKLAKRHIS